MGTHENEAEASFDASSESGTVVNHEEVKLVKKSKLLLAVLYFGTFFVKRASALISVIS
jgi:hypothetical protein